MGDVYKAYDAVLERTVAVKTLTPGNTGPQAVERLLREARACARLTHPGIVVIHDVLQEDDSVHIVMEHLEGTSLDALHRFPQASTFETKIDIIVRVLDALHYAHGRGVVHRDVKPTNVQLLPDGSVKLLDFGIAHLTGAAALTATGALTGTPHYASPEQLRGEETDASTDIYSTGILAFELLTRQRPFDGDTLAAVLTSVLNDALPAMGTSLSEAFPEIERIVRRAAAKRREDRYGSAEDAKNALAAFVGSSHDAIVAKQAEVAATTERLIIEAKSLIASDRTVDAIPLLTSVLRSNPDAEEARRLLHAGDGGSSAVAGPPAAPPMDADATTLAGPDGTTIGAPAGSAAASGPGASRALGAAPASGPGAARAAPAPPPGEATAATYAGTGHRAAVTPRWSGRRLLIAAAPVLALLIGVPAFWWMSAGPRGEAVPTPVASSSRGPESVAAGRAVAAGEGVAAAEAGTGALPSPSPASARVAEAAVVGSAAGTGSTVGVGSAGGAAGAGSAEDAAGAGSAGDAVGAPRSGGAAGAESAGDAAVVESGGGAAGRPDPAPAARPAASVPGPEAPRPASVRTEPPAATAAGAVPEEALSATSAPAGAAGVAAAASVAAAANGAAAASAAEAGTPATPAGAKNLYYAGASPGAAAPAAAVTRPGSAAANAGIKYRILLRDAGGAAREVDADTMFRSGDRIRFAFEPNVDGFLYVIQRGSSGRWSVLLPHPLINGGRNDVAPFGEVTIPPEGWFRFDDTPGSEQVFVYLSKEPLGTLPWGGGPVVRAQSVDEPTMIELANSVRSRDLVFEKEDAPDGADKAAYVVNQDDIGQAVAWTVELRHR